jgi:hypothetical protein
VCALIRSKHGIVEDWQSFYCYFYLLILVTSPFFGFEFVSIWFTFTYFIESIAACTKYGERVVWQTIRPSVCRTHAPLQLDSGMVLQ